MGAAFLSGTIACLDAQRRPWGRERFDVELGERVRTVRALTEFHDRGVRRDTTFTVSRDGCPLEGFVRDTVRGQVEMHGWYRVTGPLIECEAGGVVAGRISRRVEAPAPVEHLGLHSIVADVLVALRRGPTEAGIERAAVCVTSSMRDYGLGDYGAHVVRPLVTYVGAERVSVQAGEYAAQHFRVRWSDQVPKYSDFWVHRDSFVPLRLCGASGDVSYELFELAVA